MTIHSKTNKSSGAKLKFCLLQSLFHIFNTTSAKQANDYFYELSVYRVLIDNLSYDTSTSYC